MDSSRLVRGQHVSSGLEGGDDSPQDEGRVNEHIGPVQFNMGGIQVDADDMLQRLKVCTLFSLPRKSKLIQMLQDRQSYQTPEPTSPGTSTSNEKAQNDTLQSFFAGLIKNRGGSTTSSPKPGAS
jgi:dynein light intermediate chain 1